jgi:glycosyltransferase involved in cell wall biosynthesis
MSAMRIVHVVTRSHRRGAEIVALELAAELDALGQANHVHAIALGFDGTAIPELDVMVSTPRLGLRAFVQGSWRLRRLLARHRADIVVAHGGWAAIVVAVAAPRASARVWHRILGLPVESWGRVRRLAWQLLARRFDAVVALTRDLERETRTLGFDGPIWVIPNARKPDRFVAVDRRSAGAALRERIGVDASTPLIGFVGHLVAQKQPEVAVDVLAKVHEHGQPAHLVIAGDGPRRELVEQRIAHHALHSSVTMLGHRDDPEHVFGGIDVAVITSRSEGIPGVAIEAHMAGCPVVTFPAGSVAEVVEDGTTGLVLAHSDVAEMASALVALLRDDRRREAMGTAARSRSMRFTSSAVAVTYLKHFQQLVATTTRSAAEAPGNMTYCDGDDLP